jgi:hypothetical protein
MHPSGETYHFATNDKPAAVVPEELIRSVSELAGIAILSKYWPARGSRQEAALALAGALLRTGLALEAVERIIRFVCDAALDEEVDKRVEVVRYTTARLGAGESAFGFHKLQEFLGGKVASRAFEWLQLEHHRQKRPVQVREHLQRYESTEEVEDSALPEFPAIAWRDIFADYREAMQGTTEASDVAHFAAIWAAISANLGRSVRTFDGDELYPNAYLLFYGTTGDKKTTAQRRLLRHDLLAPNVQILSNVGSPEGMLDALQKSGDNPTVYLCFWEEISTLFARGRWKGSTLLEFLTETFDCPREYRLPYRKNPVELLGPTPSILAATTPEWFWKNAVAEDFYGGFGNRILCLSGRKKTPLPSPVRPDETVVACIRQRLHSLGSSPNSLAALSAQAQALFDKFYIDWEGEERQGIYAAAVKRIPVYARKLAMCYAACEGTLPEITFEQMKASIAVVLYSAECTRLLVNARTARLRPEAELEADLEQRFLRWVQKHDGETKRHMQQTLSKYAESCGVFNKILVNLQRADRIEVQNRRVYLVR